MKNRLAIAASVLALLSSNLIAAEPPVQPKAPATSTPATPAPAPTPMKICVIAVNAEQDDAATLVAQNLPKTEVINAETVLAEKAAELRKKTSAAKELGYTHVLLVRVTNATGTVPYTKDWIAYTATMNLRLYDVSRQSVTRSWTRRGVATSQKNSDADAEARAIEDAAENATDIFSDPNDKPKKP